MTGPDLRCIRPCVPGPPVTPGSLSGISKGWNGWIAGCGEVVAVAELSESAWRDVFGVGVAEIGEDRFAILNAQAGLLDDLRVWVRFHAVRAEREAVALAGSLEADGDGFRGVTAEGEPVVIRPLQPVDSSWVTVYQPPGLTRAQLEAVVRAYAVAEAVDESGPWGEWDEPVESLTLVTTDVGQVVGLYYDVECPYDVETDPEARDCLHVWRRWGDWTNAEIVPGEDEAWEVHPQMTAVVVAAVDDNLLVPRAAAMLTGWPAESTIVGMDPVGGGFISRLDPEFEAEIDRLLDHCDRFAEGDADVDFLQRTRNGEGLAWTEEAFGAFTRLGTALAADASIRTEWGVDGTQEWSWASWWASMELDHPLVPASIAGPLLVSGEAEVWATCDRFRGITVYGPFNLSPEFSRGVERNNLGPLFMAGYAGHGINSWGLGLIACFDAFIVVLQASFGGAYGGSDDRSNARHLIREWNRFVQRAKDLREAAPDEAPSSPRWLVAYSDYRGYADVFERHDGWRPDDLERGDEALAGWRRVMSARDPLDPKLAQSDQPARLPGERALAEDLVTSLVQQRWSGRERR